MNKYTQRKRTWNEEIQLIKLVKGLDNAGYETEVKEYSDKLLANKLSVHSSEYWAAKQSVVKLEHVFEVHSIEYNGELGLRYNSTDYYIERTYEKGDYVELVTSLWSDDHGTNN